MIVPLLIIWCFWTPEREATVLIHIDNFKSAIYGWEAEFFAMGALDEIDSGEPALHASPTAEIRVEEAFHGFGQPKLGKPALVHSEAPPFPIGQEWADVAVGGAHSIAQGRVEEGNGAFHGQTSTPFVRIGAASSAPPQALGQGVVTVRVEADGPAARVTIRGYGAPRADLPSGQSRLMAARAAEVRSLQQLQRVGGQGASGVISGYATSRPVFLPDGGAEVEVTWPAPWSWDESWSFEEQRQSFNRLRVGSFGSEVFYRETRIEQVRMVGDDF